MARVNLWEAMVHHTHCRGVLGSCQEKTEQTLQELGRSAALSMQEISIEASADGWVVLIHAAGETGEVEVLIPKARGEAVKVLKDTRAQSSVFDYD